MKNADIIREYSQLARYRRELGVTERQLKQLEKARRRLDDKINVLERVTKIEGDVALADAIGENIYGSEYRIGAVGDEIGRSAEVYPNANTRNDFGLRLWDYMGPTRVGSEHWCNTGWRFDDAVAAARRWVTRAHQPSESEIEMYRALCTLDPKGRLTTRRRLAFEAAWIAGNRTLAEQIVREQRRA